MAIRNIDANTVEADINELFPTVELKNDYEGALASMEAGRAIAEMRKEARLTQRQLAQRLGISQARISAIETGEGRDGPSYALLKRITAACGADIAFVPTRSARSRIYRSRRRIADEPGMLKIVSLQGRKVGDLLRDVMRTTELSDLRLHFDRKQGAYVLKDDPYIRAPIRAKAAAAKRRSLSHASSKGTERTVD